MVQIKLVAIVFILLISGCTNIQQSSLNNDIIQLPFPAEEEQGRPCRVPADCGIDGCIQQGNVCNGRKYECNFGFCEVEDNLFHGAFCTPFGCQETCGNSACEIEYGETDKNCPQDCLGKGLIFT